MFYVLFLYFFCVYFFFQAEDGIRYLVRSRGLGDVYKRQPECHFEEHAEPDAIGPRGIEHQHGLRVDVGQGQSLSLIHI